MQSLAHTLISSRNYFFDIEKLSTHTILQIEHLFLIDAIY